MSGRGPELPIPMGDKKQIFCSLSSVPKGVVHELNEVIYPRFVNGKLRWLSFLVKKPWQMQICDSAHV